MDADDISSDCLGVTGVSVRPEVSTLVRDAAVGSLVGAVLGRSVGLEARAKESGMLGPGWSLGGRGRGTPRLQGGEMWR